MGNLLEKITDPITTMVRVVGGDGRIFLIFVRIFRISLLFKNVYLGSYVIYAEFFLKKIKSSISNSKITT